MTRALYPRTTHRDIPCFCILQCHQLVNVHELAQCTTSEHQSSESCEVQKDVSKTFQNPPTPPSTGRLRGLPKLNSTGQEHPRTISSQHQGSADICRATDEGHMRIDLANPIAVAGNLHQGEPQRFSQSDPGPFLEGKDGKLMINHGIIGVFP